MDCAGGDRAQREGGGRRSPVPRERRRRETDGEPIQGQTDRSEAGAGRAGDPAHEIVTHLPAGTHHEHLGVPRMRLEPGGCRGEASRRVSADDQVGVARQEHPSERGEG